jgi:hypothetical protein
MVKDRAPSARVVLSLTHDCYRDIILVILAF